MRRSTPPPKPRTELMSPSQGPVGGSGYAGLHIDANGGRLDCPPFVVSGWSDGDGVGAKAPLTGVGSRERRWRAGMGLGVRLRRAAGTDGQGYAGTSRQGND